MLVNLSVLSDMRAKIPHQIQSCRPTFVKCVNSPLINVTSIFSFDSCYIYVYIEHII